MITRPQDTIPLRLAGVATESLTDGPGVRLVLFTQGCAYACPGCHNPETHDPSGGYEEDVIKIIDKASSITTGVTFSGGDPILQIEQVLKAAKYAKSKGLDCCLYSGQTVEEFSEFKYNRQIGEIFDYVKLGRFESKNRDVTLSYVGSSNQKMFRIGKDELNDPTYIEITLMRPVRSRKNNASSGLSNENRNSTYNQHYKESSDRKRLRTKNEGVLPISDGGERPVPT